MREDLLDDGLLQDWCDDLQNTRKLPVVGDGKWPMPGAPVDEIDATLLTFKPMS